MTSAVAMENAPDHTELRHVVRSGVKLGLLQCVLIALFSVIQRYFDGPAELIPCGIILAAGIAATIVLPGQWTRARTIEGIAGAAGIGFGAAITFLIVDVVLFQPVHLYSNRWLEIGGGSNWWYHPVWWMVGTYVPGMGAWIQANQTAKHGEPSPITLVLQTYVLALVLLALAIAIKVPYSRFGLGGFAVAVLPALALLVALTSIGAARRR